MACLLADVAAFDTIQQVEEAAQSFEDFQLLMECAAEPVKCVLKMAVNNNITDPLKQWIEDCLKSGILAQCTENPANQCVSDVGCRTGFCVPTGTGFAECIGDGQPSPCDPCVDLQTLHDNPECQWPTCQCPPTTTTTSTTVTTTTATTTTATSSTTTTTQDPGAPTITGLTQDGCAYSAQSITTECQAQQGHDVVNTVTLTYQNGACPVTVEWTDAAGNTVYSTQSGGCGAGQHVSSWYLCCFGGIGCFYDGMTVKDGRGRSVTSDFSWMCTFIDYTNAACHSTFACVYP